MSTPKHRYHIILEPTDGDKTLDSTRRKKAYAFDRAMKIASVEGGRCRVTVFDSMARKGAPQIWVANSSACWLVERRSR